MEFQTRVSYLLSILTDLYFYINIYYSIKALLLINLVPVRKSSVVQLMINPVYYLMFFTIINYSLMLLSNYRSRIML